MTDKNKKTSWIRKYRIYIVSSLIIIAVMLGVLYIKKFWPFGDYSLLNGDFVMQGWAYATSLHNKLLNGDSIFFTWESGYGINYYSNLAFYFNPFMLLFALIPTKSVLPAATIVYILILILTNISVLIFLTHRPERKLESGDYGNILFSLSYTLCMYVVSNTINWNFLITAIGFPIILLGLEYYVKEGKWKLYTCALAFSFLTCYYITGLFCVFIIFYYLTLKFDSWKSFLKKSGVVMVLSVLAIGVSGFLTIPTILQLTGQSYSVNGYEGDIWFTDYLNILQSFFAFNNSIEIGSSETSFGEVSLYFGLLPLLLASMYFVNLHIAVREKLRKFLVFLLYMLAFDMNPLNYFMHLFHYPSWFPNRFSWFFILYCVILGYENWGIIKEKRFKKMTIPAIGVCILWLFVIMGCYLWASKSLNSFTYRYSTILIGAYLLLLVLHSFSNKVVPRILVILGCLEIVLSFSYSIIFRSTVVSIPRYQNGYDEMSGLLDQYCREQANGFSRILDQRDYFGQENTGLLMHYNSPTCFASSINDTGIFLVSLGVYCGANNYRHFTYTPVAMSMFGNQYIFINTIIVDSNSFSTIQTPIEDIYDNYPALYDEGSITIRENKDVLSLAYMIDDSLESFSDEDIFLNTNNLVERACGITGIMQETDLPVVEMETLNCQACIIGTDLLVGHHLNNDSFSDVDFSVPGNVRNFEITEYDDTTDSYVLLTYEAKEAGEYYIETDQELCRLGYMEEGGRSQVIIHSKQKDLENYITQYKVKCARFDEDKWKQAYEILSQNQMLVEEYNSAYVKGSIDADHDGMLFASIAYDDNWHAYVDGTEAPIRRVDGGGYMAIDITKGQHVIEYRYRQKGLTAGITVSAISILVLIMIGYLTKKRRTPSNE
ncbi:MAG: YfhO family protein [Lachnospiraceae bacterium]|nr:YfhO family protein [Lachnospiraceae bacterium]